MAEKQKSLAKHCRTQSSNEVVLVRAYVSRLSAPSAAKKYSELGQTKKQKFIC